MRTTTVLGALAVLTASPAAGQTVAQADMMNPDGEMIGDVTVQEATAGGVLVRADIENLPPGAHAFHIHETGECEPPDFTSAGGHLAGDMEHGFMNEGGPHPGDFPNVRIGEDGSLRQTFYNTRLSVSGGDNPILDDDGSAVVIHIAPDDYVTEPAGDADRRIACGVLRAQPM